MLLFQQNTGICTMLSQKRGLYAPLIYQFISSLLTFIVSGSQIVGSQNMDVDENYTGLETKKG
jgi:hypothetical protein